MTQTDWEDAFSGEIWGMSPGELFAEGLGIPDGATTTTHNGRRVVFLGDPDRGVSPEREQRMFDLDDEDVSVNPNGRPYITTCNCGMCRERREASSSFEEWATQADFPTYSTPSISDEDIDVDEIMTELEGGQEQEDESEDGNIITRMIRSIIG